MRTELSTEPLSPEPNRIARSPAPPGAGVAPWTLPPAPPPAAEWQRYLAAALRFKWVVLGVTLASTALGVLGALLVKPTYVARATVWVQVPIRPARDEGPIWSGQLPISSGWMDLLQSYAVLDDVVRGLQLYVTPVEPRDSDALRGFHIKDAVLPGTYRLDVDSLGQRFTLTAHGREGVVQEGSVGDSVGAAIGFVWVPPASALTPHRRVGFTVTAPYEATGRLAKELKDSADLDGNFLRMALGGMLRRQPTMTKIDQFHTRRDFLKTSVAAVAAVGLLHLGTNAQPFTAPFDDATTHNMMIVGVKTVYLSHLPMFDDVSEDGTEFTSPHRRQVILEATFSQSGRDITQLYTRDRLSHPKEKMYTLKPSDFVLGRVD